MKRIVGLWLCAAMMVLLCAGCGEIFIDESKDDSKPMVGWDADLKEHWYVDEDGSVGDKAAHTLDEGSTCTVCNTYVVDYGDGSGSVSVQNQYGDTTIFRSYGADGTVEWESKTDIVYDEQGRRMMEAVYNDGRLQQEATYQYGKDGDELFPLHEVYYNDDGTKEETDYNETGERSRIVFYDADGQQVAEETYEYAYAQDGQVSLEKRYVDGTLFSERAYKPDADGLYCPDEETVYNPDGTVKGVTKFDADGNIVE